jgi:hypothetical protein
MGLEPGSQSHDFNRLDQAGQGERILLGKSKRGLTRRRLQHPKIADRSFAVILRERTPDQDLGQPVSTTRDVLAMRIPVLLPQARRIPPMVADHEPIHGSSRLVSWSGRPVFHDDHAGSGHGCRDEVMLVTDNHLGIHGPAHHEPHHEFSALAAKHLNILLS